MENQQIEEIAEHQNIPEHLFFPRTLKEHVWCNYLGRRLYDDEKYLFESYRAEIKINRLLKELYEQCIKKKNLYVPELTELDGDCLFSSLVYHGISSSIEELRNILSFIMYIYKDYKNFLPGQTESLKELFSLFNEIEYVSCNQKVNDRYVFVDFYKYTYNVMCQDLTNNHSWTRTPTQLILMVISYLYKVEIVIINNTSDYEHKISAFDNVTDKPELKKIYLGHIGEYHYVPIDILKEDEELEPLLYDHAQQNFIVWAKQKEHTRIMWYLDEIKKQQQMQHMQQMTISSSNPDHHLEYEEYDINKASNSDYYNVFL